MTFAVYLVLALAAIVAERVLSKYQAYKASDTYRWEEIKHISSSNSLSERRKILHLVANMDVSQPHAFVMLGHWGSTDCIKSSRPTRRIV